MLELKNVTFTVDTDLGKKTIIDNISLKIDEKFVAFTGPNGGGKSTLAKLIMGLYKPTSGKIYFDGQDITEMSITDRAKLGLGYAFQAPVKFKGITVSDLISIASGRKLNVTEICSYLSQVGLCAREYVNREVNNELSGGELKRIEIATAMAKSPKLTLFDEPEAGIDLWSFNNLISVFEKLEEQTNGSILIISHQERILNMAQRVIVITAGKITQDGKKEDILPGLLSTNVCKTLADKM
ncbi:MAG: ATP-binding cassette domain-containing protein [Clostridia bacterium]|nr:ATP-binding cassette domain-containing protein [Clostridia bacterium]